MTNSTTPADRPTVRITIDNQDRFDEPDRPWAASAEIITDAGSEDSDAAFGATPEEALTNLISEFGLDRHWKSGDSSGE